MFKYITILFFAVMLSANCFSQTFDLLISTPIDESSHAVTEFEDGSFLINYCEASPHWFGHPFNCKLLKISQDGDIVDSLSFENLTAKPVSVEGFINHQNSIFIFGSLANYSDKINTPFLAKMDEAFNFEFFTVFDTLIADCYFESGFINQQGNLILIGKDFKTWNTFIYELTPSGKVLYSTTLMNFKGIVSVVEMPYRGGYYLLTDNNVKEFNYLLEEESFNFQRDFKFKFYGSKPLTDSTFIVLGTYNRDLGMEKRNNVGCKIFSDNFDALDSMEFLSPDYNNDITYYQNPVDFISRDSIFLSFTKNLNSQFGWGYGKRDHWYGLYNMKEDGSMNWQRYYGGDAYYILRSLMATRDGGAIMIGSRWDWRNNPIEERDIY
nr:hypothetical protein [Bacteroidota bacterium]